MSQPLEETVQVLSHKMTAAFLLLEQSVRGLKRPHGRWVEEDRQGRVTEFEACMGQLRGLMDDLAELSRTGGRDVGADQVSLTDVLDEVLSGQREKLRTGGLEVDVERPLGVVCCDKVRLKQVLTGLIRFAEGRGSETAGQRIRFSSTVVMGGPQARPALCLRIGHGLPATNPAVGAEADLAEIRSLLARDGGSLRLDYGCEDGEAVLVTLPTPAIAVAGACGGDSPPAWPAAGQPHLQRDLPHEEQRPHSRQSRSLRLDRRARP